MRNYQCKKCGTLINNESQPNTSGCPNGGFHQWTNLGESGSTRYQCRNCGTLIYSKSQPNTSGCPNGGFHRWSKL